jgi:hypothetical protein
MGLKGYVVPQTSIPLAPDNNLTVRGLAFADLSKLLVNHGPQMILLYGTVWNEAKEGTLNAERVGTLIQETLTEFPQLTAEIIAIAADEPDQIEMAAKLPPVRQIEALMAIIGHTLVSEAEVKKLVEIVTDAMERAGDLASNLTSGLTSTTGSGASAAA